LARGNWTKLHQNVIDDYIEYMTHTLVVEDSDEYWDELIDKGAELCEKYNGNQFVVDLVIAHQNACNRTAQKRIQDGR
jgi:hypothetical protein